jgi:hypothetical protein
MNFSNTKRAVAVVAVAAAGLFALTGTGADAKSSSRGTKAATGDTLKGGSVGASCTPGAAGWASYKNSKNKVSVGVGASADVTGGQWSITFTDQNGAVLLSSSNGVVAPEWQFRGGFMLADGDHVLTMRAVSANGVDSCTAVLPISI